jgi:DNA-binding GntR family transcriptional regulator
VAVGFIRGEIVAGRFGPGKRLDQDEVARILGISRLPVREALIELAQKGYVTAIPRRGAFVIDLTVEDLEDHYEVIGMVIALAAYRAATGLTEAQLLELRHIHDEIVATDDPVVKSDRNISFYQLINRTGSSARLSAIHDFLSGTLPFFMYLSSPKHAATETTYREQMLEALEARDPEAAASVATEHLRECARLTIEEMRARGYWAGRGEEPDAEG